MDFTTTFSQDNLSVLWENIIQDAHNSNTFINIMHAAYINKEVYKAGYPFLQKLLTYILFNCRGKIFNKSSTLQFLKIPKDVSFIHKFSFIDCKILQEIILPDNLLRIENDSFVGCCLLKHIQLPKKLEYIGMAAFKNCKSLQKVIFPSSITEINFECFANCINLKCIEMISVQFIGDLAFYGCNNLETVIFSNNLKSIENSSFYKCISIRDINFPSSLRTIGENAFRDCHLLGPELILPYGVQFIRKNAFYHCCSLKKVIIPDSLTWLGNGDGFFQKCPHIQKDKKHTIIFKKSDIKISLLPNITFTMSDANHFITEIQDYNANDRKMMIRNKIYEITGFYPPLRVSNKIKDLQEWLLLITKNNTCS